MPLVEPGGMAGYCFKESPVTAGIPEQIRSFPETSPAELIQWRHSPEQSGQNSSTSRVNWFNPIFLSFVLEGARSHCEYRRTPVGEPEPAAGERDRRTHERGHLFALPVRPGRNPSQFGGDRVY